MPEYSSRPHSSGYSDEPDLHPEREYLFGAARQRGGPGRSDEDGLYWKTLEQADLTPAGEQTVLTPQEIGHRLWTCYRILDDTFKEKESGTTAATTVYDGKGNLITATLADAVSFAVAFDEDQKLLGVVRLSSVTHKPTNTEESLRIREARGEIRGGRLLGRLAVSRAIGDWSFQAHGLVSEATIDIISVEQIARQLNIEPKKIAKFQVVTVSDGFTDGTWDQSKQGHEEFLFSALKKLGRPGHCSEESLAGYLIRTARARSTDDITVGIQSFTTNKSPAFLLGVYDGHGGHKASEHVVENIGREFTKLCQLSRSDYAKHSFSVHRNKSEYTRDNPRSFEVTLEKPPTKVAQSDSKGQGGSAALPFELTEDAPYKEVTLKLLQQTQKYRDDLKQSLKPHDRHVHVILNKLIEILSDTKKSNRAKIKDFYSYLDGKPENSLSFSYSKNIDIIKADKHVSAVKYLAFIAIVAATIASYVLPAVFVAGIVYLATGKTPFDLLRNRGGQYENEVSVMKQRYQFFTSADAGDKASEQHQAVADASTVF